MRHAVQQRRGAENQAIAPPCPRLAIKTVLQALAGQPSLRLGKGATPATGPATPAVGKRVVASYNGFGLLHDLQKPVSWAGFSQPVIFLFIGGLAHAPQPGGAALAMPPPILLQECALACSAMIFSINPVFEN
ncbi:hypothetical protein [Vandammella animalimorsus]|uniref:hypothetical protein n=1 Tax=Vandammella animalimorsus TaxID=2029117 RepID=UPI001178B85C|nr:hypothetical protein [Vandammella animalimorsus]